LITRKEQLSTGVLECGDLIFTTLFIPAEALSMKDFGKIALETI